MINLPNDELNALAKQIKQWGKALGFQQVGIADIDMTKHQAPLLRWLDQEYHGSMSFMSAHGAKRYRPAQLVPGTVRIISARMDYLPPHARFAKTLQAKHKAYISRYAHGRDYHKLLRKRLKQLGEKINQHCATTEYRPFVDSAPVLEHAIAEKAGLGWTGKHSLTINKEAGSWFFLGELFINLPLPIDQPVAEQCGSCNACITICPTKAIVEPYVVDARRCISYLTIEHDGPIPESFRSAMGNRIYGCDDCQLVCPWNRFAQLTEETAFHTRPIFDDPDLLTLFEWDETAFLRHTEGTAIRRIGYQKWQRNIAVALGNADFSPAIVKALQAKLDTATALVSEHILWAITRQRAKGSTRQQQRLHLRLIRSIEKGLPRDA